MTIAKAYPEFNIAIEDRPIIVEKAKAVSNYKHRTEIMLTSSYIVLGCWLSVARGGRESELLW